MYASVLLSWCSAAWADVVSSLDCTMCGDASLVGDWSDKRVRLDFSLDVAHMVNKRCRLHTPVSFDDPVCGI